MGQDKKTIFISYGRDTNNPQDVELVRKVKRDLEAEGFEVLMDEEQLRTSRDWETDLENMIKASEWMLFFITPYSARKPNGYCLNELSYSLNRGIPIAPIMVRLMEVPLSICRIQYLDLQTLTDEDDYKKKLKEIVDVLNNEKRLGFEGEHTRLLSELDPIDFTQDFARHKKIIGREWVIEKVDDWMTNHTDSKVLWITAEAGYGKSAIAAHLASKHPDVIGVHFCSYNNQSKNNPERFIKTLAYHFQSQISGYSDEIKNTKVRNSNIYELYENLIANPLAKLVNNDRKFIFIIDALDEALKEKELVKFIGSEEFEVGLPPYVKIIITSRDEPQLKQTLSKYNPLVFNAQEENNKKDCLELIKLKLKENKFEQSKELVDAILDKSDANMLYLKMFFEGISAEDLDNLEKLPKGLNGVYERFFERITQDEDEYDGVYAPLFEVMLAYGSPISKVLLQDILGMDNKKFRKVITMIGSLIKTEFDNKVTFYHKSLEDWLDSESNVAYVADIEVGLKRILTFANNITKKNYKKEYEDYTFNNFMYEVFKNKNNGDIVPLIEILEANLEYSDLARVFNNISMSEGVSIVANDKSSHTLVNAETKKMILKSLEYYRLLEKKDFEQSKSNYPHIFFTLRQDNTSKYLVNDKEVLFLENTHDVESDLIIQNSMVLEVVVTPKDINATGYISTLELANYMYLFEGEWNKSFECIHKILDFLLEYDYCVLSETTTNYLERILTFIENNWKNFIDFSIDVHSVIIKLEKIIRNIWNSDIEYISLYIGTINLLALLKKVSNAHIALNIEKKSLKIQKCMYMNHFDQFCIETYSATVNNIIYTFTLLKKYEEAIELGEKYLLLFQKYDSEADINISLYSNLAQAYISAKKNKQRAIEILKLGLEACEELAETKEKDFTIRNLNNGIKIAQKTKWNKKLYKKKEKNVRVPKLIGE